MPILPIIDLLILLGWTTFFVGGVLKVIHITTHYHPLFLALGPMDLALIAGMLLLMALTLSARTWVKMNEPEMLNGRREAARERREREREFNAIAGQRAIDAEADTASR